MKKTTKALALLLALLMAFSFSALAAEALTVAATYDGADLEGATVPAGGAITLTFSNNVTDDNVLAGNKDRIKVKDAEGTQAAAEVSVSDKNTFVVTLPTDLAKGSYTLELGKEIEAKNGVKLGAKVSFSFTVKGSGSGTGGGDKKLKVDSVTVNGAPLEGAELKSGDTIVILFTNGMVDHGADSAKMIRVLKEDGAEVPCEVTYPKDKSDDVLKKQFTVTLGEVEGGSYTLVLGKDMQANNGNTLGEDVTIAFTVKAEEPAPQTLLERIKAFFLDLIARIKAYLTVLFSSVGPALLPPSLIQSLKDI